MHDDPPIMGLGCLTALVTSCLNRSKSTVSEGNVDVIGAQVSVHVADFGQIESSREQENSHTIASREGHGRGRCDHLCRICFFAGEEGWRQSLDFRAWARCVFLFKCLAQNI